MTYLPEGRIREMKDKSDVKIRNVVWRDIIWRIPKEKKEGVGRVTRT